MNAIMIHDVSAKNKNACTVDKLIEVINKYNVICADKWLKLALSGELTDEVVLTFDDGYLSQYENAFPVLKYYNLTAMFFVFTEPMETGENNRLIEHNYIIEKIGSNFYIHFSNLCVSIFSGIDFSDLDKNYLSEYSFYTNPERYYRYIRDKVLTPEDFDLIMDHFLIKVPRLQMNFDELNTLKDAGNMFGLHSYTHPIRIAELDNSDQNIEWRMNYIDLCYELDITPKTVAYPCGSYNKYTMQVMKELGIELGFTAQMKPSKNLMLFPREDIANL